MCQCLEANEDWPSHGAHTYGKGKESRSSPSTETIEGDADN